MEYLLHYLQRIFMHLHFSGRLKAGIAELDHDVHNIRMTAKFGTLARI